MSYEIRFSAPAPYPHTLSVILAPQTAHEAPKLSEFEIEEFQVHAMICEKDRILIKDYEKWISVDIKTGEVSPNDTPKNFIATTPLKSLVRHINHDNKPLNLITQSLPGWPNYQFHQVTYQITPHPHEIQHHVISRITNTSIIPIYDKVLYSGWQQETID